MPPMPKADANGGIPAVAFGRATIARGTITRREASGMSQKDLAVAAGIRPETLNRIEKCKVTPDLATIMKINRAMAKAEKKLTKST